MAKVYADKPHQVDAEPFLTATTPWPSSVCTAAAPFGICQTAPLYPDWRPHVHGDGRVWELHDTDMIVYNHYEPGVILDVLSRAAFDARYEAPRPLQEIEGVWVCSVNVTIQNPTNGQIRFNTATVDATTILALHKLTDANVDYSAALETAVEGDVFYVQSAKDARRWARYTMTADAARQEDAWYRVPVVWTQGSGQSFIEGNNKLLINLELSHRVDRTQVIP